jgi:hypothetical protein
LHYFFGINAQQLHTPQELEQYMKKSTIRYQIDSLSVELEAISFPLVEEGNFLIITENSIEIQKQDSLLNKKAKRFYKKAQKVIVKEKVGRTIKFYTKAIESQPNELRLINEIANLYWENGEIERVVFWVEKTYQKYLNYFTFSLPSIFQNKTDEKNKHSYYHRWNCCRKRHLSQKCKSNSQAPQSKKIYSILN